MEIWSCFLMNHLPKEAALAKFAALLKAPRVGTGGIPSFEQANDRCAAGCGGGTGNSGFVFLSNLKRTSILVFHGLGQSTV